MNRGRVRAPALCVAVATLGLCYGAQAADESTWFRWRPGGGVVQHVVSNDINASRKLMIGSRFHGDCKSNDLPTFSNDLRFSLVFAVIELEPHTWVALYSPIAEGEVGCSVDLMLAKPDAEAERLSSAKLVPGLDRIDFLPFHSGEVTVDASVVRDDLLGAFEPAGTSIQVQVRARNLSAESRMIAITRRRLDCGPHATYDWVLGPGEAPSQISAGPEIEELSVALDSAQVMSYR